MHPEALSYVEKLLGADAERGGVEVKRPHIDEEADPSHKPLEEGQG